MAEHNKKNKPHVLVFPFPGQGHISPMLHLADFLSDAGLLVTFLNTEYMHRRLSAASSNNLNRFCRPTFRFRTIPDGLPENDPRSADRLKDIEESMRNKCREAYREILSSSGYEGWPPVTCVVVDGFLLLGVEVAEEVGVPTMIFRASNACLIWTYCNTCEMIKRGEIPFDDGNMDKKIESVKGMESFLRRRDLPSLYRQIKSTDDQIIPFRIRINDSLSRAQALIINTIESIEAPVLAHIRSVCTPVYTLGPLHALASNTKASSVPPTVWQEDRTCLLWLDAQPPKSVVYVSFGSAINMSKEDLIEFWHGLFDSGYTFLWVIRPDLVRQGMMLEDIATYKRGRVVSWAPQQEVLAHPAVGCFLTHSGWNSTLESIASGVPMICWPMIADQLINSRLVSEVWGIGVDMKDMRGRSVVEKMVREVMDGEGAGERRRSAEKMAKMAKESVKEEGSSYKNLQKLIQHIKSFNVREIRDVILHESP